MDASTSQAGSTLGKLPDGEKLFGKPPPDVGEWLFKDKEQVLGPVPPELLLGKLYEGHVSADTPVATEMGKWKPLREIWFLGAHVSRAQQKLAYQTALGERQKATSKFTRLRIVAALFSFLVMSVVALGAARWTMIARPWADKTDWLTRRPALEELPDRTPRLALVEKKPDEPKQEEAAAPSQQSGKDNDDRGRRDRDNDRRRKPKESNGKEKGPKQKEANDNKAGSPPPDDGLKTEGPKAVGIPVELTAAEMMGVFKTGGRGYTGCIREEAARNPEMPGTITVEFVIRNDGATSDFRVQEREVRAGPLATCLGAKIAALRFPRFSGERKTFIFPFKITRKQ